MNEKEKKFLVRASTALILIREGVRTTSPLGMRLGYKSTSGTRNLIKNMKARGWVAETPGKCATLRLTKKGEAAVRHLTLVMPGTTITWRRANP